MKFEWDEAKNRANVAKHGIDFADACQIFEGPVLTELDARFAYGEARLKTYGVLYETMIVAVIHTDRDGTTRLISARTASRKERKVYEGSLRTQNDDGRTGGNAGRRH